MDKYLYTDEEFSHLAATVKDLSDIVKSISLRTSMKRVKSVNPTVFGYRLKKARFYQVPEEFYCFSNFDDEIKILFIRRHGYLIATSCKSIKNGSWRPPFSLVKDSQKLCGFSECYCLCPTVQEVSYFFLKFVFAYLANYFGASYQFPLEIF